MNQNNSVNMGDQKQDWSMLCMFIVRDIDNMKSDVDDLKADLKDYKQFNDKKVLEIVQAMMEKHGKNREDILTMQVKVGFVASGITVVLTLLTSGVIYLAKDIILSVVGI